MQHFIGTFLGLAFTVVAVALFAKAAQLFSKVFGSCQIAY